MVIKERSRKADTTARLAMEDDNRNAHGHGLITVAKHGELIDNEQTVNHGLSDPTTQAPGEPPRRRVTTNPPPTTWLGGEVVRQCHKSSYRRHTSAM